MSALTLPSTAQFNLYTSHSSLIIHSVRGKEGLRSEGNKSQISHMGQRLSFCSNIHGLDFHCQVTQVCFVPQPQPLVLRIVWIEGKKSLRL